MEIDDNFFDFGFSDVPEENSEPVIDWKERLDKYQAAVLPLLNNLKKDPDKAIVWKDRDKKITAFQKKLEGIYNGE